MVGAQPTQADVTIFDIIKVQVYDGILLPPTCELFFLQIMSTR